MKRLGVDCGNTIFDEWNGILMPGSMDVLKRIAESQHFDEIYVVSKANTLAKLFFRARFYSLNFWDKTGIPRKNLYFCRRYKDKAAICEELGITHFIDDRLKVLHYLDEVKERYAFNPVNKRDFRKYPETAKEVMTVRSWNELSSLLLPEQVI